ncbi:MAG: YraN family protein [Muribaculaceae bacterium]|nr:YraN family protein [Muribaculaceae bacterium]
MKCDSASLGRWGEEMAKAFLTAQGFAIKDENWRMAHYELDIVIQEGNEIIFVEVKTRRSDDDDPIDAVDRRKRARMIASAEVYINELLVKQHDMAYEYRFDIVGITGTPDDYEIEYIPDAFFPALGGNH